MKNKVRKQDFRYFKIRIGGKIVKSIMFHYGYIFRQSYKESCERMYKHLIGFNLGSKGLNNTNSPIIKLQYLDYK